MPDDGDDLDNAIDDGSRTGQSAAQAQASAPLSGQPEFDFDDIAMPAAAATPTVPATEPAPAAAVVPTVPATEPAPATVAVPAVAVAVAATEPAPPATVQPEPMAPEDPDNFVVESVEVVHEEHAESPAIVVTVSSVIETETEEAPAPAPVFSSAGLFDQVAVHADADTESSTDTDTGIAESQPDPTPAAVPTWVTEEREQASPDRQA